MERKQILSVMLLCDFSDQNAPINAVNLTANVFYYKNDVNKCSQALNLTWIARPKGRIIVTFGPFALFMLPFSSSPSLSCSSTSSSSLSS